MPSVVARDDGTALFYSGPAGPIWRGNLTLFRSDDDGQSWTTVARLPSPADARNASYRRGGYSCAAFASSTAEVLVLHESAAAAEQAQVCAGSCRIVLSFVATEQHVQPVGDAAARAVQYSTVAVPIYS